VGGSTLSGDHDKSTALPAMHGIVKVVYEEQPNEQLGGVAVDSNYVLTVCPPGQSDKAFVVEPSGRSLPAIRFASKLTQGLCMLEVTGTIEQSSAYRMNKGLMVGESVFTRDRYFGKTEMRESRILGLPVVAGRTTISVGALEKPSYRGHPLYNKQGYLIGMFTGSTADDLGSGMAEGFDWVIA
jgi:hypothetical protein